MNGIEVRDMMDNDQQDLKRFLEQQLERSKEQIVLLDEINVKLIEMKRIAQYVVDHELSESEMGRLDHELNDLKDEVHFLEKQLHTIVH